MDHREKVEEFRISIRRKNLNQKMQAMRAKQKVVCSQVANPQEAIDFASKILNNDDLQQIYKHIRQLKLSSQNNQVMAYLKKHFQTFYSLLINLPSLKDKAIPHDDLYRDICTILINITSQEPINFANNPSEDIAGPLLPNIRTPRREIISLWLVANILYRHNELSGHFMKALIQWGVVGYVRNRLDFAFNSQTDRTLFYYFVGSIAANLDSASNFTIYTQHLGVIEQLALLPIEELYWYLLDGLAEHAQAIPRFNHELLATTILDKCGQYCKAKKTRFVLKYLQLICRLLHGQGDEVVKCGEQGRRKVLGEQYSRLKSRLVVKNLQFCLQNRSPQVKRWLFELGFMLIVLYKREISFSEEYFYLTLAQQARGLEKHEQRGTLWFLKYLSVLLGALLEEGSVLKNKEYREMFVQFVESTDLFDKIGEALGKFGKKYEILSIAMDVLAFLLEYDLPALHTSICRANLTAALEKLQIESPEVNSKREKLLDVLMDEESLRI